MANKNFNNFTEDTNPAAAEFLVGFTSASSGGERKWSLNTLKNWLATQLTPTGTIVAFAGQTIPSGWLLCNGQSTSSYPSLKAVVGNTVPDLRGYFIRGAGTAADGTYSGSFNTTQQDSIKAYTATNGKPIRSHFVCTHYVPRYPVTDSINGIAESVNFNDGGQSSFSRATNTFSHETRPKNVALNYIIKT